MRFETTKKYNTIIPDYELIKKESKVKKKEAIIEAGKVLLVISNKERYYFENLYCVPEGKKKRIDINIKVHLGMMDDSYLIRGVGVYIRYFQQNNYLKFYLIDTNQMPLYIQNNGDSFVEIEMKERKIEIKVGERKEIGKK